LNHYANLLVQDAVTMISVSKYITVDAFFSKKSFIDPVCQSGFHAITRLRDDAVMSYAYTGIQKSGRGRKKQFDGKIDVLNLRKDLFTTCIKEDKWTAFEGLAYVKSLKRWVKAVIVHHFKEDKTIKSAKIYISTDTSMSGADVYFYYHLRFQIEFVYRDAKQHLGLNHCQSTQKDRLNFHFNFALTILSLTKIVHWITQPINNRMPFSIYDIKTQYFNERFLNKIFNVFGIDPEHQNNKFKVQNLMDYTKIAA
jgi:hypothetical protein